MKSFSIQEAFLTGWEAFKRHALLFVGLSLSLFILLGIPSVSIGMVENQSAQIVLNLVFQLYESFFTVGFIRINLAVLDGQEPKFATLFSGVDKFLLYFVATVGFAILFVLGLFLLVVPGIILALMWQYYGYFIVDKGMGLVEAFKASAALTEGVRWKLLGFGVLFGLLNVVGALLAGLGLLVTIPVSMLAYAHVYRQLLPQTRLFSGR